MGLTNPATQLLADKKAALNAVSGEKVRGRTNMLLRALSRPDPLMQFDWDVNIQLGGAVLQPEYVETVTIPGTQTASEPVFRSGTKVYVATVFDVGAVTLRLYEDVYMTSTKFLQSWFRKIHKDNGAHGVPSEYKGYMQVIPMTPEGVAIGVIKCIGIFPTQHPPFTFGSENERVVLDVEFSCDAVEIEFTR